MSLHRRPSGHVVGQSGSLCRRPNYRLRLRSATNHGSCGARQICSSRRRVQSLLRCRAPCPIGRAAKPDRRSKSDARSAMSRSASSGHGAGTTGLRYSPGPHAIRSTVSSLPIHARISIPLRPRCPESRSSGRRADGVRRILPGNREQRHEQVRADQATGHRPPASPPAPHRADRGHGVRADRRGPGARERGSSCAASVPSPPARVVRGLGATRVPAVRWPCRARPCRTSKPAKSCSSASTRSTEQRSSSLPLLAAFGRRFGGTFPFTIIGVVWLIGGAALDLPGAVLAYFPVYGQKWECLRHQYVRRTHDTRRKRPWSRGRCRDATLPSVGRPTGKGRRAAPLPWRRRSSIHQPGILARVSATTSCPAASARNDREHDGAAMLRAWQCLTFAASAGRRRRGCARRALFLILQQGLSQAQAAEAVGVQRQTVNIWLQRHRAQGEDGMLDGRRVSPRRGKGLLTAEEAGKIQGWIRDRSPNQLQAAVRLVDRPGGARADRAAVRQEARPGNGAALPASLGHDAAKAVGAGSVRGRGGVSLRRRV